MYYLWMCCGDNALSLCERCHRGWQGNALQQVMRSTVTVCWLKFIWCCAAASSASVLATQQQQQQQQQSAGLHVRLHDDSWAQCMILIKLMMMNHLLRCCVAETMTHSCWGEIIAGLLLY
jgi:hypothetical protein